MLSRSVVSDSATLWTVAHQAPLSMGFSGQEQWNGLPCPPPGNLPNPGIEPRSPALQADSLPAELSTIRLWSESHSVVSNSLQSHGLYSPWDSPGQNTGVGSPSLLQGIFPTQVSHTAGGFFTSWATRVLGAVRLGSVQSLSLVRLCDPVNCNMPDLPVHHQLLELTQTQVHQVSDAIQSSPPLSAPSTPAFNLNQYQGFF